MDPGLGSETGPTLALGLAGFREALVCWSTGYSRSDVGGAGQVAQERGLEERRSVKEKTKSTMGGLVIKAVRV